MGKILIEDTEIELRERDVPQGEQHIIEGKKYINRTIINREFESTIYSYGEVEKMLVSKVSRFNMLYYKIVLFHDESQKAWNLIEIPVQLDVQVKRMCEENFVITADGKGSRSVMSQISFCKLKPSTKVEEKTISFTTLNEVRFIASGSQQFILISYSDLRDEVFFHTLALYNAEGKCEQTLYEFAENDDVTYTYEVVDGNKVKIYKQELTKK